jgi:hypothetical protein
MTYWWQLLTDDEWDYQLSDGWRGCTEIWYGADFIGFMDDDGSVIW